MPHRRNPSGQADSPAAAEAPQPSEAPPEGTAIEVRVAAPSRLHFGLLAFGGKSDHRQYGGVGAMIRQPGLRLTIRRSGRLVVTGPLAGRAADFARRFASAARIPGEPRCRIDVEAAPPEHVGLGTGTQLGLAVVAGLAAFFGKPLREPESLARAAGRGARSAVGAHGFVHGGLLLERGKLAGETISPLADRVPLPSTWRFVLFRIRSESGLSGAGEQEAFARLEAIPEAISERLLKLAVEELLPAAAAKDFARFGENLYRYGRDAGMCFAAQQHGPFASPASAALVAQLRSLGAVGVGQSSWGPTIYALAESSLAAEQLVAEFRAAAPTEEVDWCITPPDNEGATIECRG